MERTLTNNPKRNTFPLEDEGATLAAVKTRSCVSENDVEQLRGYDKEEKLSCCGLLKSGFCGNEGVGWVGSHECGALAGKSRVDTQVLA
jgi:hypothetical protein